MKPNIPEMRKSGLKEWRHGEFSGYSRDNKFYLIRVFGNKTFYSFHPSFWIVENRFVKCPYEESHPWRNEKICPYTKELKRIEKHNQTIKV